MAQRLIKDKETMSGIKKDLLFAPLRLCVSFICAALILASAGCQTLTPDWSKNWLGFGSPRLKESKYAVPARMAIMWSPAILNQAGESPTRGFGGRTYFYDAKNQPIAVEGQLVVYAYNNDKPNQNSKVPDRKFAFTPEQFTKHYSPTELGASYSIWIPWDAVGQPQTDISLAPIFTSSSGALVMARSMSAVGSVTVSDRRSISLFSTRFRAVDPQPFTQGRRPGRFHRIPRQVTLQSASRRSGRPACPGPGG
jgi:hypothetical protein